MGPRAAGGMGRTAPTRPPLPPHWGKPCVGYPEKDMGEQLVVARGRATAAPMQEQTWKPNPG